MSAPIRQVPHLWELQALIVDMMHFDIDTAAYDPDELEDYTEQLYGIIRDAAEQFKTEIGGYTL